MTMRIEPSGVIAGMRNDSLRVIRRGNNGKPIAIREAPGSADLPRDVQLADLLSVSSVVSRQIVGTYGGPPSILVLNDPYGLLGTAWLWGMTIAGDRPTVDFAFRGGVDKGHRQVTWGVSNLNHAGGLVTSHIIGPDDRFTADIVIARGYPTNVEARQLQVSWCRNEHEACDLADCVVSNDDGVRGDRIAPGFNFTYTVPVWPADFYNEPDTIDAEDVHDIDEDDADEV
jgi:hypothetical protein